MSPIMDATSLTLAFSYESDPEVSKFINLSIMSFLLSKEGVETFRSPLRVSSIEVEDDEFESIEDKVDPVSSESESVSSVDISRGTTPTKGFSALSS